jgi:phage terminase large subunit-like protein
MQSNWITRPPSSNSWKNWLASLSREQQIAFLSKYDDAFIDVLRYDWAFNARHNQFLPDDKPWQTWLIIAGRGFGKTRTGAETVREWVKKYAIVNIIGATADDARDIMIEGESGILAICPNDERPNYKASKRQLEWPNGAKSLIFTADEPERLRGKQHMKIWADELAAWRYSEAWDQAMFGLRLGDNPQAVVTTTPRPIKIVRDLMKDPNTYITRGTTYDNRNNLAPSFFAHIIKKYEGTRLGRQELNAEILDDNPHALWKRSCIDELRLSKIPCDLRRVVVGVDPSVTSAKTSDETGIIVAGVGKDDHAYIIDDLSLIASPDAWGRIAVNAYHENEADRLVAEVNNGGDLVEMLIRTIDPKIAYKKVHATRGKAKRAEPIAALYEQGKVHHVGSFPKLEDQMCSYDPEDENGDSPDRMDALVWALSELMLKPKREFLVA